MFDYNKAEAVTLGFEPLGAQMSKPEISVVNLSDYTQVTSKAASASIPTTSSAATFVTAALPSSSNNSLKGTYHFDKPQVNATHPLIFLDLHYARPLCIMYVIS